MQYRQNVVDLVESFSLKLSKVPFRHTTKLIYVTVAYRCAWKWERDYTEFRWDSHGNGNWREW